MTMSERRLIYDSVSFVNFDWILNLHSTSVYIADF